MPERELDPLACRAEATRFANMARLSPFKTDKAVFQAKADAWRKRAEELERSTGQNG